ncbi:MAG: ACP S-malonyltransferase [Calditrichaeota bacterium]|nr:ACP S-malonyltransferase [Calditrichota bacterium]
MHSFILVFPGQASQSVGMGRNFYTSSPAARAVLDRVAAQDQFKHLPDIIFIGPDDLLTRTDNVQPAITLVSLMALAAFREAAGQAGIAFEPVAAAGHSLGEYAAHAAAGNLSESDVLDLVRWRGYWMNEASQPPHPKGAMIAVMGLDQPALEEIADRIGRDRIAVANFNSPGQIILSGTEEAVAAAITAAQEAGARRVVPLNVSGAWHSPLMAAAQAKMAELLAAKIADDLPVAARPKVVANATANAVESAAELRSTLTRQITWPVRWVECVRELLRLAGEPALPSEVSDEEYTARKPWPIVIEVGPGKVLRGLLKNIDRKIVSANVEDPESLAATMDVMQNEER